MTEKDWNGPKYANHEYVPHLLGFGLLSRVKNFGKIWIPKYLMGIPVESKNLNTFRAEISSAADGVFHDSWPLPFYHWTLKDRFAEGSSTFRLILIAEITMRKDRISKANGNIFFTTKYNDPPPTSCSQSNFHIQAKLMTSTITGLSREDCGVFLTFPFTERTTWSSTAVTLLLSPHWIDVDIIRRMAYEWRTEVGLNARSRTTKPIRSHQHK